MTFRPTMDSMGKRERLQRLRRFAFMFEWSVVDLPDGGYRYHGHGDSAKLIVMRNRDTGEWEIRRFVNRNEDPSRASAGWVVEDFTALVPEFKFMRERIDFGALAAR